MKRRIQTSVITIASVVMACFLTVAGLIVLGESQRASQATAASWLPSAQRDAAKGLAAIDWPRSPSHTAEASAAPAEQGGQPWGKTSPATSLYANCRLGVGVVRNRIDTYPYLPNLRVGWYYDWSTTAAPVVPFGIEYAQTVRVSQLRDQTGSYLPSYTISPPLTDEGLGAAIDANPGMLWMAGNEPDVWSQDGVTADQYAEAYHDIYHFIKQRDPSARVAIAAVSQPTPLRLVYLERVLDHYRQTFGSSIPVDVWNIHVYIIREVAGDWGVQVPPGFDEPVGIDYPVSSHGNTVVFAQLIEDFRSWMAQHGQRDKPLVVSEMGVLMPEWWQPIFDETRVNQFMHDSFDYLLSAASSETGYPRDNNRLVQQWNWFSLDDDAVDATGALRWNGMLFNSTTKMPTAFGQAFALYSSEIPEEIDLSVFRLGQQPVVAFSPGNPMTITLKAEIANAGNMPFSGALAVHFYEVSTGSEVYIGSAQVTTAIRGCAAQSITASVVWPNVAPGNHRVRVRVEALETIPEWNILNNTLEGNVLIGSQRVFLPFSGQDR